ncbi:unnamed protein product [Rotaria sp. Silwood2]|nr:unnamed protein product [Rotaria sp. Silwood2]CAF3989828.1 unnamed protein product [Rotaria sp. Silwood2]
MKCVQEQPTVRLMNAVHGEVLMPVVGLGTGGYGQPDGSGGEYWGSEQGHNATVAWLKMGGRRIDTSDDYASRDGIGTGWIASGVPRSEIFITSKVNPSGYDQALEEFASILKSLQTDYIDLLLIHWPGVLPGTSNETSRPCKQEQSTWTEYRIQTWRALETIFQQKRLFTTRCPDHAVTLDPTWNPIPDLRTNPSLIAIAKKHSKTPVQVVLRWHWQQGIVINPRTRDPSQMMENMSIFDFELDNQDMMALSYLNHPMSKVCGDPRLIL